MNDVYKNIITLSKNSEFLLWVGGAIIGGAIGGIVLGIILITILG